MNSRLKLALLECGVPQYVIAQRMGVSETRLSRIIRGRAQATREERKSLSELLGVAEEDIASGPRTESRRV